MCDDAEEKPAHQFESLDPPSKSWLGSFCPHPDVPRSGMWDSDHVGTTYDTAFLDELEKLVGQHTKATF